MDDHQSKTNTTLLAWMIVIIVVFFYLFERIVDGLPSAISSQLSYSFHASGQLYVALTMIYVFVRMLMLIPSGILLDKFHPRRTLTIAALLMCIGLATMATTQSLTVLLIAQIVNALGSAFAFIAVVLLITIWMPKERRAFYICVALAIGACSNLLTNPITFFANSYGWRSMALLLGTLAGGFSLVIWLLIRNSNAKTQSQTFQTITEQSPTQAFKKPVNWLLCIYGGLIAIPMSTIGLNFVYHQLPITLTKINTLILLGLLLGTPTAGWFSDRWKIKKSLILVGTLLLLLALTSLFFISHLALGALVVLFFTIGFGTSFSSLIFVMATDINPTFSLGTSVGLITAVIYLIRFPAAHIYAFYRLPYRVGIGTEVLMAAIAFFLIYFFKTRSTN